MNSTEQLARDICTRYEEFVTGGDFTPEAWQRLLEQTNATLLKPAGDGAFDALLWILANEDRYVIQNFAGELLNRFDVKCRIELTEFLRRVLPRMDASAANTAEYLARVFGRQEVLQVLDSVPWSSKEQIKALRYNI